MSHALVSGRAGLAFVERDDGTWRVVERRCPDAVQLCGRADVAVRLRGCRDVQVFDGLPVEIIEGVLSESSDFTDSVDSTTLLLDRRLSEGTRKGAAKNLEALLLNQAIRLWWQDTVWARPLPAYVDMDALLSLLSELECPVLQRELVDLRSAQGMITCLWEALWSREDRDELLTWAVSKGLFRRVWLLLHTQASSARLATERELDGTLELHSEDVSMAAKGDHNLVALELDSEDVGMTAKGEHKPFSCGPVGLPEKWEVFVYFVKALALNYQRTPKKSRSSALYAWRSSAKSHYSNAPTLWSIKQILSRIGFSDVEMSKLMKKEYFGACKAGYLCG